jgi:hypothetical protein
VKLHPRRKRPRLHSLSNQMTQFNANSRVIVSRVDVSEDVRLSPVRRVLLKMPDARREKLCERYLTHGGKSSVAEVPDTVRKVLWKRYHARREESCGERLTHSGSNPAEDA